MKRLNELQSLNNLSRALGQELDEHLQTELQELQAQQDRIETRIRKNIAQDLNEIFAQVTVDAVDEAQVDRVLETIAQIEVPELPVQDIESPVLDQQPTVAEQVAASLGRQIKEGTVVRPEAEMPAQTAALEQKLKYLENWVSRIAATGPGGGAAQVYNLDMPTKLVTTSSYTIGRRDYYIGVNYAGLSYITLPTQNLTSGRDVIIKDESGRCEAFPITVIGNVDNDPGGFRLEINNGAIHLIYRDGWRIV